LASGAEQPEEDGGHFRDDRAGKNPEKDGSLEPKDAISVEIPVTDIIEIIKDAKKSDDTNVEILPHEKTWDEMKRDRARDTERKIREALGEKPLDE
jgi:hypothetical protein